MKTIRVPQELWFREKEIALSFPDGWRIDDCRMASDGWKGLTQSDMKKALENPIGSRTLESLAKGKKEVVILFDDMTRPTRPSKVVLYILEKLGKAGIKREGIRFIVSSGAHGALRLEDFKKKLGRRIVESFPVYNHNSFENCGYAGTTSTGLPLYLNKEFLSCDLRIGIGSILPHIYCGFSGGGKIVLPGISHIKTIERFHTLQKRAARFGDKKNICLKSICEAAKIAGLHFKIDFIINTRGAEVGCFAGDPVKAFMKGIRTAERAYATSYSNNYDVIIANAYTKSNEADLAIHNLADLLNPRGGIFILIAHNPHGQVNHYLLRSYGKFIAGRNYKKETFLNPRIRYVIFSPYKEYNAFDTFDRPQAVIWRRSWGEILKMIKSDFMNPSVAVFGDATSQLVGGRPGARYE